MTARTEKSSHLRQGSRWDDYEVRVDITDVSLAEGIPWYNFS